MYKLYFIPDACSLATQVIIRELGQNVELVHKSDVEDFASINPVGTVPVLVSEGKKYTEGAAVALYLLEKHDNNLLPSDEVGRRDAIQDIMFANATMHPAYNKLIFTARNVSGSDAQAQAFNAAANEINRLWSLVETRLADKDFLRKQSFSAADIMLTVYSRWGQSFPVDIHWGPKTQKMIDAITSLPSFKQSIINENTVAA